MKVLIVNTLDIEGGAARAAYRLHKGLISIGVDSKMIVQRKLSEDVSVIGPSSSIDKIKSKIRPTLDSLPKLFYKNRKQTLFSPAILPFSDLVQRINSSDADLVNFHWINGGFIRIEDIARINKPIVWTLHDDWAFTGGCHIKWDCVKYKRKCESCSVLGSTSKYDLSYSVFKRKQRTYLKIDNLTVVGVSQWLSDCARQSSLLKSRPIFTIPNPLNTNNFKPIDKSIARSILGLPKDTKLVLFGAMGATSDPNKGFKKLVEALKFIKSENIQLMVFGASEPVVAPEFGAPVRYLGRLHDDLSLCLIYSAADVMVVPSIQEAFGQTASESMACGTPVVSFGATGLLDIIDHKINGYLAEPYNSEDLAMGVEWVIGYKEQETLRDNARKKVAENFEMGLIAKRYKDLYSSILLNYIAKT